MKPRRKRAESRARYFVREEARKRGWKVSHPSHGGDCLEEQEVVAHFPDIGLALERPDFLFCLAGEPAMIIETKGEPEKIAEAIDDASDYARAVNNSGRYTIRLVVGVAGDEDSGYVVEVRYLVHSQWSPLLSHDCELTNIPSKQEAELALQANDATTVVTVPSAAEFIDAAIELSRVLRTAKVEPPLRPKVIGAMVLAMYQGTIKRDPACALDVVNSLVREAIWETKDIQKSKKEQLADALKLSGTDFNRLSPYVGRIIALLRRLNVRSVVQTDADFLGGFYEAFLRYGYDSSALGIVFTPRHITRFCVDLIGTTPEDEVIDIACGTGGFLVSAFDRMMKQASGPKAIQSIKASLYGLDTNPTVWALAMLNMFFRGDGKSHIDCASCFDKLSRRRLREKFSRAFLNPPFSQKDEPERDFIDAALANLKPGGELAVVVKAGIFADDDHRRWRHELCRRHRVLGVISLPEDLFYPTASPTSILIAKAHEPTRDTSEILMARVWNDGFEKLKNRRVQRPGNQLPDVLDIFSRFRRGKSVASPLATVIKGRQVRGGEELSPQEWLPQPRLSAKEIQVLQDGVLRSIFQAVAASPELADIAMPDFGNAWANEPDLPIAQQASVGELFTVMNGKSVGEKHYPEGSCPYISSGDALNSIVGLVEREPDEVFPDGGITVTAFGQAYIQPWPFMARGNGGSAVRVLIPRFNLTLTELLWFAAQINSQKWRFFYARMSIKSRLERLVITRPPDRLKEVKPLIAERILTFRNSLSSVATV